MNEKNKTCLNTSPIACFVLMHIIGGFDECFLSSSIHAVTFIVRLLS
jgi:hypothetical protein